MDLTLDENQQMIQHSAREFFQQECPMSLVREMAGDSCGVPRQLWLQMAEMGYLGLPFPEEYGGMASSFLDLCVLIEEFGRFRVPGPLMATVVHCGLPIARFGNEQQKSDLLNAIVSGQRMMTYAQTEPAAGWSHGDVQMAAVPSEDGFILNGEKLFVPYAQAADTLLVATRGGGLGGGPGDGPGGETGGETGGAGLTLLLVDANSPGVTCQPMPTIGQDHQSAVRFRNVTVPAANVLGQPGGGEPIAAAIQAWGAAATSAEMVGGAACVLDMSVEYAKTRTQFDRPIGSFQAMQHLCANMAVDVISSRLMAYEAIWRLSEGLQAAKEISMAKAWVSDAYQRICMAGHQIHGAVGFTEEHDLHVYLRHAKATELAFGDGDHHREELCQYLKI